MPAVIGVRVNWVPRGGPDEEALEAAIGVEPVMEVLQSSLVDAPIGVAEKTGLMRTSGAGNVYLCEPLDPVVFERIWTQGDIAYAALAQVAVDCLTGPDRMPAEGEALLEWMVANEDSWRLDA